LRLRLSLFLIPTRLPEAKFVPRKAYRECLNRNFAFRLINERNAASPDTIAEEALLACRAEEGRWLHSRKS
jgi:hypothetical protein